METNEIIIILLILASIGLILSLINSVNSYKSKNKGSFWGWFSSSAWIFNFILLVLKLLLK